MCSSVPTTSWNGPRSKRGCTQSDRTARGGRSIASADVGARYGNRLRKFGFGCPAPLPDGRLAFLSSHGNLLIRPSARKEQAHRLPSNLQDLSPLPDNRLLCTTVSAAATGSHAVEFVIELSRDSVEIERVVIENYGQADEKSSYNYYARDFSVWASSTTHDDSAFTQLVAYALGRIGDRAAAEVLLDVIGNLENAVDVRHASALALKGIGGYDAAIAKLAVDYPDVSVRKVLLSMSRDG